MTNNALKSLRNNIDTLDEELVNLLSKRFALINEISQLKSTLNLPPLSQDRFNEILVQRKSQSRKLGLDETLIQDIFNRIHKASLNFQKKQKHNQEPS